jgi:hypothetical protein
MKHTEEGDVLAQFICPYSVGLDFEQALAAAESFLQAGDLHGALQLLTGLEKRYVVAVKLFDLIGEIHIRLGMNESGVRYKSIHEVLRGTFKIAGEKRSAEGGYGGGETRRGAELAPLTYGKGPVRRPAEPTIIPEDVAHVEPVTDDGLFPVTEGAADQFMRQGHFERAAEIFGKLLEQHPDSEQLKASRDEAVRRSQDKKVLGVLKGWLGNIEKMRGETAGRQ